MKYWAFKSKGDIFKVYQAPDAETAKRECAEYIEKRENVEIEEITREAAINWLDKVVPFVRVEFKIGYTVPNDPEAVAQAEEFIIEDIQGMVLHGNRADILQAMDCDYDEDADWDDVHEGIIELVFPWLKEDLFE